MADATLEVASHFRQLAECAPNVVEPDGLRDYFEVFAAGVRKAKKNKAAVPKELRYLTDMESIADVVCLEEARAAWYVASNKSADLSSLTAVKRQTIGRIARLAHEGWTIDRFLGEIKAKRNRVWTFVKNVFDERVKHDAEEEMQDALCDFMRDGFAYVTNYYIEASPTTRDALQNRLRTRLLQGGAVCVSTNKYVDVAKADAKELAQALGVRVMSITSDIRSAQKLLNGLPIEQRGYWLRHYPFLEAADHAQERRKVMDE